MRGRGWGAPRGLFSFRRLRCPLFPSQSSDFFLVFLSFINSCNHLFIRRLAHLQCVSCFIPMFYTRTWVPERGEKSNKSKTPLLKSSQGQRGVGWWVRDHTNIQSQNNVVGGSVFEGRATEGGGVLLREGHGGGQCLPRPLCHGARSERQNLNVNWALESRDWRKKRTRDGENGATAEP